LLPQFKIVIIQHLNQTFLFLPGTVIIFILEKENLIIRKVELKDNNVLASMIRQVFEEFDAPQANTVYSDPATDNLFALFQNERSVLWVAEVDGKASGCCGIYPTEGLDEDCAELSKFYLAKSIRGQGIGKLLMIQCIQSAKAMRYKKLYLESMPQFAAAVSMYEKYGFRNLGNPLGNSGHTSCNIWMVKDI
jgi:putative acetyltransferase